MTHTTLEEAKAKAARLSLEGLVAVPEALSSLADQLEAVTTERDAYKLDAERYRWLRDIGDATWTPLVKRYLGLSNNCDEAIDAAIAKEVK